jgi:hypothetical protein
MDDELKGSTAKSCRGSRQRSLSAWLAIVALLLDGLLPTGFSLAPAADTPVIGFCGSAPAPAQERSLPGGAHCIYCLVAAIGPAPAPMPALEAQRSVTVVILPAWHRRLVKRTVPLAAAQPRGPPAVA